VPDARVGGAGQDGRGNGDGRWQPAQGASATKKRLKGQSS